jgi:hypothetical protein
MLQSPSWKQALTNSSTSYYINKYIMRLNHTCILAFQTFGKYKHMHMSKHEVNDVILCYTYIQTFQTFGKHKHISTSKHEAL